VAGIVINLRVWTTGEQRQEERIEHGEDLVTTCHAADTKAGEIYQFDPIDRIGGVCW
jgi:hypothetical protein